MLELPCPRMAETEDGGLTRFVCLKSEMGFNWECNASAKTMLKQSYLIFIAGLGIYTLDVLPSFRV